jgi:cytochrome c
MIRLVLLGLMASVAFAGQAAAAESLAARLAAASPENGEKIFRRCHACHSNERGGPHVNGPNLWGVVGRPVASAEGFDKYSEALRATGGTWTPERLDAFLTDPHEDVHGTRMPFTGLEKPQARADLIAYLNQNSDAPLDLAVGSAAPAAEQEPPEFGVLYDAEGVEATYAYCSACHSERLVAQQGLTREGWAELIEWMVDEQGMAEIEQPDYDVVLDYLSTHYNTDRPHFPY